jgi:hypothetical protein
MSIGTILMILALIAVILVLDIGLRAAAEKRQGRREPPDRHKLH